MKIKMSPKYYKVLQEVEFAQFNEDIGLQINSIVGRIQMPGEYHALFERVKGMNGYYSNGTTLVTEEEILSKGSSIVPWVPKLKIKIINLNTLSKEQREEFEYEWNKLSKKNYAYLMKYGEIPLFISLDGKIPRKKKKKFKKLM